jgi:hypothetical protein
MDSWTLLQRLKHFHAGGSGIEPVQPPPLGSHGAQELLVSSLSTPTPKPPPDVSPTIPKCGKSKTKRKRKKRQSSLLQDQDISESSCDDYEYVPNKQRQTRSTTHSKKSPPRIYTNDSGADLTADLSITNVSIQGQFHGADAASVRSDDPSTTQRGPTASLPPAPINPEKIAEASQLGKSLQNSRTLRDLVADFATGGDLLIRTDNEGRQAVAAVFATCMSQIRFTDGLKHKDLIIKKRCPLKWHEPSPRLEDHAVSTIVENSYPPDRLGRPGLLDVTSAGRRLVAIFCVQKLQSIRETYKLNLEARKSSGKAWDDWDDKYDLMSQAQSVFSDDDEDNDPYAGFLNKFQADLCSSHFTRR